MFNECEFLLRGNVVDLAPDFSGLTFTISDAEFRYGEFLNAVIAFVIIGAAVFFLIIKPVNTLMARRKAGLEPAPEAVPEDVVLLGEIRDLLREGRVGA